MRRDTALPPPLPAHQDRRRAMCIRRRPPVSGEIRYVADFRGRGERIVGGEARELLSLDWGCAVDDGRHRARFAAFRGRRR
jgi:hypothetical protein